MRSLLFVLAGCVLAGCAGGTRSGSTAAVYDFGLPAERLNREGAWSGVAIEIRTPPWLDARDIDYRLLYDDPLKLRSYASSHWAAPPGLLLAQRLRQQIGLVGASAPAATRCLLRLELFEFSQVFDSPRRSRGLLQGRAHILDAARQIVAEWPVNNEQPAPAADARGGVVALIAASDELGQQLAAWLNDLEKHGRLKPCRKTVAQTDND